jgi:hypothetical protein
VEKKNLCNERERGTVSFSYRVATYQDSNSLDRSTENILATSYSECVEFPVPPP